MSKIKSIKAREVKDSRGNPTVEVVLETDLPARGAQAGKGEFIASCPSGASTGKNEAVALPAKDAIENVNKIIAKKLVGKDLIDQKGLDKMMVELDGTENKSELGANAILPVSMAICRAGAAAKKLSLYQYVCKLAEVRPPLAIPLAMFNFIEGGAHAVGRNKLDLQEFLVVPHKKTFQENLVLCNKIFNSLKMTIKKSFGNDMQIGDEGGFAPNISKTEQALFLLKSAIEGEDVKIAIDAAASQFYKNGRYAVEGQEITRSNLVNFYADLVGRFDIISIEDPFSEEDFEGFKEITKELPDVIVIGDDLTVTNIKKIKEAHSKNACNGVVIKPNQIGTVLETIEASSLAKSYGWKTVVSHRSGETMDTFIADLAVGLNADFIKSGSPALPERMVKYNRLLEIENELSRK